MSSNTLLGAAADERKARLAKLRSIKRKQPGDEIVPPESDRASPAPPAPAAPAALRTTTTKEDEDDAEPDVARLHLSGRNYDPESRGAKLGFEAPPNLAAGQDTLEAKAARLEEEVRKQQQEEEEEDNEGAGGDGAPHNAAAARSIDLFKLQPKKPNWDLKRELNKRLEPLNAQTDKAIAKLIRERLAAKKQQQQEKKKKQQATQASQKSQTTNTTQKTQNDTEDADEPALEGPAMVEALRVREQEQEEEERREREADEA